MTVADDQLARVGSVLDGWDRDTAVLVPESLLDPAGMAHALFEALQPIIGITIKLGVDPAPGSDRERTLRGQRVWRWPVVTFSPIRSRGSITGLLAGTYACWSGSTR